MILKFCYQNEIHRSSDAPVECGNLHAFLQSMFKDSLPKYYSLTYLTNEGQSVALKTEQDYENLKVLAANKAIKVIITAEESEPQVEKIVPEEKNIRMDSSDYDIIAHPQNEEEPVKEEVAPQAEPVEQVEKIERVERVEPVEERKVEPVVDVLANVSEELTKAYVLPMLETLGTNLPDTSLINSIVQEKLRAQMPLLLVQVRETVLKHSAPRVHGDVSQKISYPQLDAPLDENVVYQGQRNEEEKQDFVGKVLDAMNDLSEKALKALGDLPDKTRRAFNELPDKASKAWNEFPEKAQKAWNDLPENASKAWNEFPEKASKALNEFPEKASKALNEFPEKAAGFADNIAHQITGDPYVEVPEGRYPKSIVEKASQLKEFFPESETKELLDFVTKFPKEITLDEIAHHYANTKGM